MNDDSLKRLRECVVSITPSEEPFIMNVGDEIDLKELDGRLKPMQQQIEWIVKYLTELTPLIQKWRDADGKASIPFKSENVKRLGLEAFRSFFQIKSIEECEAFRVRYLGVNGEFKQAAKKSPDCQSDYDELLKLHTQLIKLWNKKVSEFRKSSENV